jgi:hypothetical protein
VFQIEFLAKDVLKNGFGVGGVTQGLVGIEIK